MNIVISDEALIYLKKNNAKSVIIFTIENETSACCGGSTKKIYVPELRMGFDSRNLKAHSVYYYNGFKILLSDKININEEQLVVIDIEKILFIHKLIVNGIKIKINN